MNATNLTAAIDPSLALTASNGSVIGLFRDLAETVWEQRLDSSVIQSRFRGLFTYCISPYGITCLAMALLLNRVVVLCSNSGFVHSMPPSIRWRRRSILAAFRVAATILLLYQLYLVMVALNLHMHISLKPLLTTLNLRLVRFLLPDSIFAYDPAAANDSMLTPKSQVMIGPTTDMYWDVFVCFCILLTVDVFVSTLEGRSPFNRSGLTIFEHSLAFQEFSCSELFYKEIDAFNRPTEQVLVSTIFLLLDHVHNHVGALFNDNRYRLIPSTIIGLSSFGYCLSCLFHQTILGFPLIIIFSYYPELVVLLAILVSAMVLLAAYVANGFSVESLNFASFFTPGTSENPVQINHGILYEDDFHSALLRVGLIALTSAGKSSYMSELGLLRADQSTWPERELWLARGPGQGTLDHYGNGSRSYSNVVALDPSLNAPRAPSQQNPSVFRARLEVANSAFEKIGQLSRGLLRKALCRIGLHKLYGFSWLAENNIPAYLEPYVSRHLEIPVGAPLVRLDLLSETQISALYLQILNGDALSMHDDLATFTCPISDSDSESDSESESQTTVTVMPYGRNEDNAIQELLSGTELTDLLTAQDFEIVRSHMAHDGSGGVMTRARFRKSARNEGDLILSLLAESRPKFRSAETIGNSGNQDTSQNHHDQLLCVVCQTNCREIVTWPCKCFSICESCRLSLVSRGIDGCVICRRPVEGVSRIFIP